MGINLLIQREKGNRYQYFHIDASDITLLEALYRAKKIDSTLQFRSSCGAGLCGSCAVTLNGRPVLACQTRLFSGAYVVEPLNGFPVINDLIVDKSRMDIEEKEIKWLLPRGISENHNPPFFSPCISCGICVSGCTTQEYHWGARTRLLVANYILSRPSLPIISEKAVYNLGMYDDFRILPQEENLDYLYRGMLTCTACGRCEEFCPKFTHLDRVSLLELAKEKIYMHHARVYHEKLLRNIPTRNSYGEPHEKRFAWMPQDITFSHDADVGIYFGCSACYRTTESAKSIVRILKHYGIKFTASPDEWCCGSTYIRTGLAHDEIKQQFIPHNVAVLQNLNVDTIVTPCSGCFRTFNKDYPLFYGKLPFKVKHVVQYLVDLVDKGRISLPQVELKATFHDSCHMGRGMHEYDAPRKLLQKMGIHIVEMKNCRETSNCCGGGGGTKSGNPDLAVRIASKRVKEALDTGVSIIFTTCVFCTRNLNDAIAVMNAPIRTINIETFLANLLYPEGMIP